MIHELELLLQCRRRGIVLWAEQGRLLYRAPQGALTPDLRAALSAQKDKMLAFFERVHVGDTAAIPVLPRTALLPLTSSQRRLWFIDQFQGENAAYNIPFAYVLDRPYRIDTLRRALAHLTRRHEALRLTLHDAEGRPGQKPTVTDIPLLEVTVDGGHDDPPMHRALLRESQTPFHLATGPLCRFTLFRTVDGPDLLAITMHHVISDGASMALFHRELRSAYDALDRGDSPRLPQLPIQFADYAAWQQQHLIPRLPALTAFWEHALRGAQFSLDLPTDRPRPKQMTFHGAQALFTVAPTQRAALEQVAEAHGVTPYSLLLTAFQVLLARYTGQDDFLVGAPVAGRDREEVEHLVGLFVNTVPVRAALDPARPFSDTVRAAHPRIMDVLQHQDMPLDLLVERLRPERDLSRNPLFQVMFVLHPQEPAPAPSSLATRAFDVDRGMSHVDLTLSLTPHDGGLAGTLEYNTDLFDAVRMARMTANFQVLLSALLAAPQTAAQALPLLAEDERAYVLHNWNQTAYRHHAPMHTLPALFAAQAEKTPDARAVAFEDASLTYAEFAERCAHLGRFLRTHGVGPNVLVGVSLKRSLDMVVALYGIHAAGGAYTPIDPDLPPDRVAYMVADAAVGVLLTSSACLPLLPKHDAHTVCLDTDWTRIEATPETIPLPEARPEDAAYMIYTSGSTGNPKGVINHHAGICNRLLWGRRTYCMNGADRLVQKTPYSFDVSVWEFFWPLQVGACLVVARPEGHKDSAYLVDLIRSEKITISHFVPSMLQIFLEDPNAPRCTSLRQVFCSGEALPLSVQNRFFDLFPHVELHNLYGPTEASVEVTYWACRPGATRLPIGMPIDNTAVYVLDPHLRPVPLGVTGELHLAGIGVARGYHRRPALTAEKFVPDPFTGGTGARMYKTGDAVRQMTDGQIDYIGRIDFQVKIRGLRIELGEIDAALHRHGAVRDAVVVAASDNRGDKFLAAYVVPRDEAPAPADLRRFLGNTLPDYMVPTAFVFLDAMPISPNGKIDRKALPAPERTRTQLDTGFTAPATPTERTLTDLWQTILGLDRIGVHDNFFQLGGHSLTATQIVARARTAFEVALQITDVFLYPTIAGLAEVVDSRARESAPTLTPVTFTGPIPLSFTQERLWFIDQLQPLNPAYNIAFAYVLSGPLHTGALETALNHVVARQASLRTYFVYQDTTRTLPAQAVKPHLQVTLRRERATDRAAAEARVKAHALEPFALDSPPLCRFYLLQLEDAPETRIFQLVLHHIIADGWSVGVLLRELSAAYAACLAGDPSPPTPPAVQYVDFAYHQRAQADGHADEALAFWRNLLEGSQYVLQLPSDRPRPNRATFDGAAINFTLTPARTAGLKQIARADGDTLFMTLFAAFGVLMGRYSGQRDFLIGTPVAARGHAEVEDLIGCFVNTLVLRMDLRGNPSFHRLQERVKAMSLAAFDHQDFPFERLVDVLEPERDISRNPLFQVMFNLQNQALPGLTGPGLSCTPFPFDRGQAHVDLALHLEENDGGFACILEYNTHLFDAAYARRMSDHFLNLIDALTADPDLPITHLELLDEEARRLLLTCNRETREVPQELLHARFFERAPDAGDATALRFGDTVWSYADLAARAEHLAGFLRAHGVQQEVVVGISMDRRPDMLVAILAVLRAGGAYVSLDPAYPRERLAFILEDTRAPLVLTESRYVAQFADGRAQCIPLDTLPQADAAPPGAVPPTLPAHLAYFIYTSGSTGKPKGVAISHRNAVVMVHWAGEAFSPDELAGTLFSTSTNFDLSIFEMFAPLSLGGSIVLVENALHLLEQPTAPVTLINTVPSVMTELLSARAVPASVRTVNLAGEPLPPRLVRLIFAETHATRVCNLYGPSEDTTYSTWADVPADATWVPIGKPLIQTQALVLDAHLRLQPMGIPGELYLAGEGLARGYLYRPGLTAERFICHPFAETPGDRVYRTGDLVRYRDGNQLEFLGRIDHQVKIRGFRIELGEIEARLSDLPHVSEVLVVVLKDRREAPMLVAYLVTDPDTWSDAAAVHALSAVLPDYMVPAAFVPLHAFPLTPNKKIDRKALPAPESVGEATVGTSVPPDTPTQVRLAAIWSEVLERANPGIHTSFFNLGGHSLSAIRVLARIRDGFGLTVSLTTFFQNPTLAGLAAALDQMGAGEADDILPTPKPESEPSVLSFAQHGLWFIDRLQPGNPVYNIFVGYHLHGPLCRDTLTRALTHLVARHEALRTHFPAVDGKPCPVVAADMPLPLTFIACTDEPQQAEALARKEARTPFVLADAPLVRFTLLHLGEAHHQLLVNMHHMISDGWSCDVLLDDLLTCYAAFEAGTTPRLPDLPLSFTDVAYHQRRKLRGSYLEGRLNARREQLSGAPYVAALPTDKPRPMVQAFRGAYHRFSLDEAWARRVVGFSAEQGVTPYMTLLAVYGLLLARYTGQDDLLIGSPSAGRGRTEMEAMVGYFVNAVVLRLRLDVDADFAAYLEGVRRTTLDTWAEGDLPFDLLVEHLQPDRDLSRNPLFQVMFALQEKKPPRTDGPFRVTVEYVDPGVSHFDLTLGLERDADTYTGIFEYNTDLFEGDTIARMTGHYLNLLQALLDHPERALHAIPMMDEPERRLLLHTWNDSGHSYDRGVCFHHMVEAHARANPHRPALIFGDTRLGYGDLNRRADQLAHHLRAFGVGLDTIVGISMPRCAHMFVALLGILKAGGAYLSLDPDYPPERLAFMIDDTDISLIVSTREAVAALPPHQARLVLMDEDAPALAARPTEPAHYGTRPDNLAYVIYTSGTTGKPKGVMITQGGLTNLLTTQRRAFPITESDRVLVFASLNFDAAIFLLTWGWQFGAAVYAAPKEQLLGTGLGTYLAENQITLVLLPPSVLSTLQPKQLPKLQHLLVGGEAVSADQAAVWSKGRRLINAYGPTEVTVWGTWTRLRGSGGAPIGMPVANAACYVVDRRLRLQPIGVPGELLIAGDGLARGYLKRPALTAGAFIPNPFGPRGSRLYRTGDLARRRTDGRLDYLGRIDHQVKIRGFRVEPDEIAARLREHPAVEDALVLAREDRPGDLRLVAYMVSEARPEPTASDLRAFLGERLPDHMIPAAFVVLTAWPLTADGSKVDRRALPVPGVAAPDAEATKPRSEVEAVIIDIWKSLLRVDQVGTYDNFFDLGGHSLLLAEVQSRLSDAFGREIAVTDLFHYPTVAGLAEFLSPGHVTKALQVHATGPRSTNTDVAIIGMAGRFPMADDVDTFWRNLKAGRHCITFFSLEELQGAGVDQALLHNPDYVRAVGYLEDIDCFDAQFFGYSPRDARILDPQQRQFLQGAWHALEHAGYNCDTYPGRISLYAGTSASTYMTRHLLTNEALMDSAGNMQVILGNDKDFLPTRVSYKLNLKGAGINVQTACSSSLVAVHAACMSLVAGECDAAMAGGVRLVVPGKAGYLYEEGSILSPDGHCRAFDKDARGVLAGSGYGIVVLKLLETALADGDTIHALIKGSAVNNDGSDKIGFTAPSIEGQAQVIAQAHAVANVHPDSIGYIEAHGTGTTLGDPIEIAALTRAFRTGTQRTGYCAIGSVKTNIGHLDAAAGVTGLIKAALTLKHGLIPASLHYQAPNPKINFDESPFFVNTEARPFPRGETPRRAGISSFGLGGTNAHAVLEEPPELPPTDPGKPRLLLPLSAKTPRALEDAAAALHAHLDAWPDTETADVAYTLQVGRVCFAQRAFVVCADRHEAMTRLAAGDWVRGEHPPGDPFVVFMFSGQGAQYVDMARDLYAAEPSFRDDIDYCCDRLMPHLDLDLRDYLYPDDELSETERARRTARLNQTDLTQPALFTVAYALARLWLSWGIKPDAMIGHSIGELAAATLAGVFELEDALGLVAMRGRLMQSRPPGDMLAVPLPEADLQPYLVDRDVSLAAVNAPNRCVVSGPSDEIQALAAFLETRDLACRTLHTSHAFHSSMMNDILEPFAAAVRKIKRRPPVRRFVSNVTGTWITDTQACDPTYWADHLRGTVRFAQGIDTLLAEGRRPFFLEVGPGKTLVTFAGQIAGRETPCDKAMSLRHPKTEAHDCAFITESLGRLWVAGARIDWGGYYGDMRRRRIPLPGYPFARDRFWVEPGKRDAAQGGGRLTKRYDVNQWFYVPGWKRTPLVYDPVSTADESWLIFEDTHGVGDLLARRLHGTGARVTRVRCGSHFERHAPDSYSIDPGRGEDYEVLVGELQKAGRTPRMICHLWNITPPDTPVSSRTAFAAWCMQRGFLSLMHLVKSLDKMHVEGKVAIGVVANGMQEVNDRELTFPEKATLLGAVKVIPREHPDFSCRGIDITLPAIGRGNDLADRLLDEIRAGAPDTVIALRGRQRWVQCYDQVALKQNRPTRLRQGGTYLITGGLSGVGLLFAEHLAQTVKARLVLTRRSPFPRREDWDQWLGIHGEDHPISRTIERLRALEKEGAAVLAINGDVADMDQMRNIVAEARTRFGKIHGVFHAAGVLPSGTFADMTSDKALKVFRPKVQGTLVLSELLGDQDLDFMFLFSSTSAILGNMGYGDYVAANAFLDAFAWHHAGNGGRHTLSVNWDGWQEVGMAVGHASAGALANAVSNKEGREVLTRLMACPPYSQVAVSTLDLQRMIDEIRRFMGAQAGGDLADELEKVHAVEPPQQRPEGDQAFSPPSTDTQKRVAAHWCEALGFDKVGLDDDFYELGGDSLLGTMLASKHRKVFKVKFGARLIGELPTVAAQAAHIDGLLAAAVAPERPPFEAPATDTQILLAGHIQDVLGITRVGLKDSFTDLGGTLPAAVTLAGRLAKAMQVPVTADMVMDEPLVADFAESLDTLVWAANAAGTPVGDDDITEFDI